MATRTTTDTRTRRRSGAARRAGRWHSVAPTVAESTPFQRVLEWATAIANMAIRAGFASQAADLKATVRGAVDHMAVLDILDTCLVSQGGPLKPVWTIRFDGDSNSPALAAFFTGARRYVYGWASDRVGEFEGGYPQNWEGSPSDLGPARALLMEWIAEAYWLRLLTPLGLALNALRDDGRLPTTEAGSTAANQLIETIKFD